MPEVSIVIPAYNRAGLLYESLMSCLKQTYQDFEIIVVDDGSEADIREAIKLAEHHSGVSGQVRYIQQPRRGANVARNRGVNEAAGIFIQFLDSDDLLHPQKVEIQREFLSEQPELDMVFGLDEWFHNRPGDMQLLWNTPNEPSYLDRFLWDDPVWNTGSPLWRSATVKRIGGWDERLICWQDWEFHIRALCRGITYHHVPKVLQYIRDHDQTRSTNLVSLMEREKSKLDAALSVVNEIKRASLWTSGRGDALATFLLSIAVNINRGGSSQLAKQSIGSAIKFAGQKKIRVSAVLMRLALLLPRVGWLRNHEKIEIVYKIACRFKTIPRHQSHWKSVPSAGLE